MTSIAEENHKVTLQRTPLYDLHIHNGAKMVEFAGYSMPVQYDLGVMKEHLHTRLHAGLFDVSHMGQVAIRAHSGSIDEAKRALEKLVPCDLGGLADGRQRYTQLTNEVGGIRDDLMIADLDNQLLLVVNASRKRDDEDYLIERLARVCTVEALSDRALIALQGPLAERVLSAFVPDIESMRFMDVRKFLLAGAICVVSRPGYTGEDGFEISIPSAKAMEIGQTLLEVDCVELIGLGARDTLRLEAGLCLHVRWRCAVIFAVVGTLGAFAGSSLGKLVDGNRLLFLFGLIMVAVGAMMLRPRPENAAAEREANLATWLLTAAVAFLAGIASGFFGIGGGFLIVPGLMLATRMPMIKAVGSSLLAVGSFGLATAINYSLSGLVDWRVAGEFIAGGSVGGLVGMMLANRLSHGKDPLTRIFAVLIFVVAAYVLYRSGQTMMS